MRLVAYLRVSSDGQVDGYGLEAQESAVRSWCKDNGHQLTRFVTDVGVSGASDAADRPGLSEVLETIRSHRADGLVVARLDRLARALTVQEATLAVIWRSGGSIYSADHGRILQDDPDDPMRTALRQVVGVFAELDRRMVVKRLRDGRTAKSRNGGKSVGSYPYGYTSGGKGRSRRQIPQEQEQEVVQLILSARACGRSYRAIVELLNQRGIAPRRATSWSPMTVRSVV